MTTHPPLTHEPGESDQPSADSGVAPGADLVKANEQLRQEIVQLKPAYAALAKERELLRALIDHLPEYLYIKDTDHRFILGNAATAHGLGVTGPADYVGKTDFDFFPAELAAQYQADEQKVIRSGQPLLNQEEQVFDPSANKVGWASTSTIPLPDDQGRIIGLVGISRDITELKLAQEALSRQNKYLAALHDTTLDLISRLDLNDLLENVVSRAAELLGAAHGFIYLVEPEENVLELKVGTGVFSQTPNLRLKLGEGLSGRVWQSGQPLVINDYETWSGRAITFDETNIRAAMGVPLKSGAQVVGAIGIAYDNGPERSFGEVEVELLNRFAQLAAIALDNARLYKAAQEARTVAEAADRAKSAFLASVSHELRTPLTSVLGFAKIIKKRLEVIVPAVSQDDRKVQRAIEQVSANVDIIVSEGDRLTALINDVLDLAKIESGKIEWHMQPLSIQEIIERSVMATSALFAAKAVEMVVDVEAGLPTITGDQDRLIQVVINLISNAAKFTSQGSVTCRARRMEDRILVSVIDTGIGIAPDDHKKVFEQFVQVGDTLTDKPKGTGLGLSISKQIVEHHGGRLWVESELEQGSNFSFTLPVSAPAGIEAKIEDEARVQVIDLKAILEPLKMHVAAATPEPSTTQKTILVVDDDQNIRRLLRQELEAEKYRVHEAADGREALEQVKSQRPDLITLDVMMPGLSGFEVAAMLRASPETMGIPIIIVSVTEDKDRGYRLGVDRYFTKPLDTKVLLREVGQLLEQGPARKRVLVVDEDPATVEALTGALKAQGYHVVPAYSSEESIEKAITDKPNIVIVNSLLSKQNNLVQTLRVERGLENTFFMLFE
ncbi:MAG: response regulator [Anaerolineales bacterium]|nr:response regulator [Anaerolineales bacterium]